MHILYVEDDPFDADLTRRELRKTAPHIDMDLAGTQREALSRLSGPDGVNYDLVLSDVHLRDGDGLAILAHIRSRQLPLAVVLVTGEGDEETAVAVLKAGADDHVVKRGDYLERLPLTLEDALRHYRTRAAKQARPLRVLYAEHNAADADLLRCHLEAHAPYIRMDVVADANEALLLLSRHGRVSDYDILLLDYRLPGLSALEMLKELRQVRGMDIPVVLVTGYGDEEVALQALKLGASDYVPKNPGYLHQLPGVLENAFHSAQLSRDHIALRESEERFETVFRNSPVGIVISRLADGCIIDVNDAYLRLSGNTREDVIGHSAIKLNHWVDPRERSRLLDMLSFQGRVQHFHMKFRRKNGEVFDSMISAERVELKSEPYMLALVSDISHLKQAEEALLQRLQLQEQFSKVSASVPGAVYSFRLRPNGSFSIPFATLIIEDLLGVSRETLAAEFTPAFANVDPEDIGALEESIAESGSSLSPWHTQFRYIHPGKGSRWIEGWSMPQAEPDGGVLWHGFLMDITEHKQVEAERKKAEAQLRQAQKMEALGVLAGGIAHDFNNILGVILGYGEMAQIDAGDPVQLQEDLGHVIQGARRAKDLVRQILAFSRQDEQEKMPLQVGLIVKEVLKMLRASLPSTIEIRHNVASKAGVVANPSHIHQVLMNLCTNAAHAMEGGPGVLEVVLKDVWFGPEAPPPHPDLGSGHHLELVVKDTGKGIPPSIVDRIFDPFFTTKEPGVGTGLGLSVVHGIVKSCGGAIHVESMMGKGSAFHIFLPAFDGSDAPRAQAENSLPGGTERILVVDDEPALAMAVKRMLEKLGYSVEYRSNGLEALEAVRRQKQEEMFDLVITDMTMPHLTGIALAREVLKLEPHPLIVLCTGFSEKIDAARAQVLGIHGFLAKPVVMKDLAGMVRKVLDSRVK